MTKPAADEAPSADPTPVTLTKSEVDLTFEHLINYETLSEMITKAMKEIGQSDSFELKNPDYTGGSNDFESWTLEISSSQEQTEVLLAELEKQFEDTPVWRSSNSIGATVANDMKFTAMVALLASLMGIILYIWIRFQRVIFGLAAVVA